MVKMMQALRSKGTELLDNEDDTLTKISTSIKNKNRLEDRFSWFKGNIFIVLEYISHDLTGLMDLAYCFSDVQANVFIVNYCRYLRENKCVHRDTKSYKILIDSRFFVKLVDF